MQFKQKWSDLLKIPNISAYSGAASNLQIWSANCVVEMCNMRTWYLFQQTGESNLQTLGHFGKGWGPVLTSSNVYVVRN